MIVVKKCVEHKDGSATVTFDFEKEDHAILLRHGLVALLTIGAKMYEPKLNKKAVKITKRAK
jgi:hypothetical protein